MSDEELSEITAASATWAWATEHAAPEWASTAQLIAWLGRGELPPHTLVWKQGWGEWLPALQVAELAAAFPRVTAGSRRVARAAAGSAARPPAVPIAHYPRLRLLAKDVLSESPLPPAAASRALVTVQAERHGFRDPDHQQQDAVTSQVPAAAMLEAARAMKQRGAPAARSSAERWGRLELGTFGEPPPAAVPLPAAVPSPTAVPSPPAAPLPAVVPAQHTLAAPPPARPTTSYGRWLLRGAVVGCALGLLSVSWPEAAQLMTRARLSLLTLLPSNATSPKQLREIETQSLSLSPLEENACVVPADAVLPASVLSTRVAGAVGGQAPPADPSAQSRQQRQ